MNESVDEILTDAEHAAVVHINTLFSRIYRNENIDNLLPDLSYITGQPCTYDEKSEQHGRLHGKSMAVSGRYGYTAQLQQILLKMPVKSIT